MIRRNCSLRVPLLAAACIILWESWSSGAEVTVYNDQELRTAIKSIAPKTVLKIGAGKYTGGYSVRDVTDLTVTALDPKNPPLFQGGSFAWHFSCCAGLTVSHLRVTGQADNGLNLDDGGDRTQLVKGITIEGVEISNIGPSGNHDALKGSGLQELTVRDCTFTGWGGQGIDLVGCHKSTITGCRFTGKAGFSASAGVQLKGGSTEIVVEDCHFVHAGERPINVGGSTGQDYFRPPTAEYEAQQITVRRNTIAGGLCAAAFVGVDGAEFSDNTILFPEKWLLRILQENRTTGFAACRDVLVRDNRFVFRRSKVQTDINIGDGTAPETLRFEGNHWFAEDRPQTSLPKLPTPETNGTYGVDPRSTD